MPDAAGLGDLWMRTARLCECCDILVDVTTKPPGWKVTFRPRDTKLASVEAVAEHLLDAMGLAVNRAEAAGLAKGRR